MQVRRKTAAAVLAAACLAFPGVAQATPVSASLTGANGEGSFDDTLTCAAGGDGPSWRYAWLEQPASSSGGLLAGEWNGTFEVHDAGRGGAFVPNGDGRLAITVPRGGTGFLDLVGGGDCQNATLAKTIDPQGDPVVSGSLPFVAKGGTGALRGLIGSGVASFTLELGAGADNFAAIDLAGALDVLDPALTIVGAGASWGNLTNYLQRRLGVSVTVKNATGSGDAFDVGLAGVTGGTGAFAGLPAGGTTRIPAGGTATFSFLMHGAQPNQHYAISATATGKDGLFAAQAPVTGPASFKAPLLP